MRGGFIVLPERPRFRRGDEVRIARGAFAGLTGLYAGMRGPERIAVLLATLGRVELAAVDIEPA